VTIIYIAGPYRARTAYEVMENINRAGRAAAKWWARGFPTICPHKNTAFFDGVAPDRTFLDGDIELLVR